MYRRKVVKNRSLSRSIVLFNKLVSKIRWIVGRIFGSIMCLFESGKSRYKGLARVHVQNFMEGYDV
ncbi:MAG: hypothetical protein ACMUEL_00795 [Flavobacteriales bacterium Tduv]